jgi:hypothetical protein
MPVVADSAAKFVVVIPLICVLVSAAAVPGAETRDFSCTQALIFVTLSNPICVLRRAQVWVQVPPIDSVARVGSATWSGRRRPMPLTCSRTGFTERFDALVLKRWYCRRAQGTFNDARLLHTRRWSWCVPELITVAGWRGVVKNRGKCTLVQECEHLARQKLVTTAR